MSVFADAARLKAQREAQTWKDVQGSYTEKKDWAVQDVFEIAKPVGVTSYFDSL